MHPINLKRLQRFIIFFRILYLTFFAASAIFIILEFPTMLWVSLLVIAIIIRMFISAQLVERYKTGMLEQRANQVLEKKTEKPRKKPSKASPKNLEKRSKHLPKSTEKAKKKSPKKPKKL